MISDEYRRRTTAELLNMASSVWNNMDAFLKTVDDFQYDWMKNTQIHLFALEFMEPIMVYDGFCIMRDRTYRDYYYISEDKIVKVIPEHILASAPDTEYYDENNKLLDTEQLLQLHDSDVCGETDDCQYYVWFSEVSQ